MEKKLVASDYDCTLYSHRTLLISEEDRESIRAFREKGNVFVIVTGRSIDNITSAVAEAEFGEWDMIIAMNGTTGVLKNGQTVFEGKGDAAYLPAILAAIGETGGKKPAVVSGFSEYFAGEEGEIEGRFQRLSPEECAARPYFSCLFSTYPDENAADVAVEKLKEEFGGIINPQRNGVHVDIPPAGYDKGEAVRRAAEYFGVKRENVFTVGDNMNDASMILPFNGYAMESGNPLLKEKAGRTAQSVAEVVAAARQSGMLTRGKR